MGVGDDHLYKWYANYESAHFLFLFCSVVNPILLLCLYRKFVCSLPICLLMPQFIPQLPILSPNIASCLYCILHCLFFFHLSYFRPFSLFKLTLFGIIFFIKIMHAQLLPSLLKKNGKELLGQ